jgi:predicted N-acetyltransferase YhbS
MITNPIPSMHADIKSLWRKTFGDSEAYLAHYFARMHRDENMLVCTEDDEELVAMMTMLPITLKCGGLSFPARYVYAVATDEQWRGLGISTSLMEEALEIMEDNGEAAAILVPAHFSLFAFYERQGFTTAFYACEEAVDAASLPPPEGRAEDIDAAALFSMRERAFKDSSLFASWDADTLGYIAESIVNAGGAVVRLLANGDEGHAVAVVENGLCLVKEISLSGMTLAQALSLLHARFGAKKYVLHRISTGDPDPIPFGMIRWIDKKAEAKVKKRDDAPYLGLVMD